MWVPTMGMYTQFKHLDSHITVFNFTNIESKNGK